MIYHKACRQAEEAIIHEKDLPSTSNVTSNGHDMHVHTYRTLLFWIRIKKSDTAKNLKNWEKEVPGKKVRRKRKAEKKWKEGKERQLLINLALQIKFNKISYQCCCYFPLFLKKDFLPKVT